MNDREWDIFMMEVEAQNEELIQEFLISQMRPRDLAQIEEAQQSPEESLIEEANAIQS